MRRMLLAMSLLLATPAFGFGEAPAACGASGQACCATAEPCGADLGCATGICRSIQTDTVAFANYCKRQLGFVNPEQKMAYVSCFDAPGVGGTRIPSGRQVDIQLSIRDGDAVTTHHLRDNGPIVRDGKDIWDLVYGTREMAAQGCDNPNYLSSSCDPYYRLNVWKADPGGNDKIVAALHCRDGSETKPRPANAVTGPARLGAFLAAPTSTPLAEKTRLFDQWNGTSEIVLILANLDSGKTCFFHASRPYFGSRIPAPDDDREIATPGAVAAIWDELPVKPPFGVDDQRRRGEWVRNAANGWYPPNYMACTGCHDSGPFLHNPFIDSTNAGDQYLPIDRRQRPYLPLGYQSQTNVKYLKTDPVRVAGGGTAAQKCTSCHSMGAQSACGSWFDRALGWSQPYSTSEEARHSQALKRYMPPHRANTTAQFYEEYGAHIDAMKCCCDNPDWSGCRTLDRATPGAEGRPGTGAQSCVASTCGGWGQECCASDRCNHGGLTCESGSCRFLDEVGGH